MEEHEKGIEFVTSILDKEQEDLSNSKRQHHTDWDNHILTLSTASLGFTFTFLPISNGCHLWLVYFGVLAFILAICFTTANYIVADKGINIAFDALMKKRVFNERLKQELFKLNKLTRAAEQSSNEKAFNEAHDNYETNVEKLFADVDFDGEIKERDRINNWINRLNHAKTYSFIVGILFIVAFSIINIDKFTGVVT